MSKEVYYKYNKYPLEEIIDLEPSLVLNDSLGDLYIVNENKEPLLIGISPLKTKEKLIELTKVQYELFCKLTNNLLHV